MTHPSVHHAAAACWSLRTAWPKLTQAAIRAQEAAAESGDLGTLRSQALGTIGRSGHGDPIGTAIELHEAVPIDPYTALETEVRDAFARLAAHVLDDQAATLTTLIAAVPDLPPVLAGMVADGVDDWDRRVRKLTGVGHDWVTVPDLECPGCGASGVLALRTSAPRESGQRFTICTTAPRPGARFSCRCRGARCGCGMSIRERGVLHIWTADEMHQILAATGALVA